tara:strand:+ start:394 stop:1002 length:609 start_codon:yes stop_codon:yes gene_type:complete
VVGFSNMNFSIENFIGIFDDAFDELYCKSIIEHFEKLDSFHKTIKRSDYRPAIEQQTDIYQPVLENDSTFMSVNEPMMKKFNMGLQECYELYIKKYPVLETIGKHRLDLNIKIQRTVPGQGYHIWHCEHDGVAHGKRLFLVILYLNEVEGGETEFLYQHKRISPKTGSLMICPSGFTHTHRGNPPLSGVKYIMNGWIEFIDY